MLTTRLIACLDVVDGNVTKARRFEDNIVVGDVETVVAGLYQQQIDEVIFYDILASAQNRRIDLETVERVASRVFIPLTVGGGIKSLEDMHLVLDAGAEKISMDSMAVKNPELITQGANEFGRQCIVVSMQVKRVVPTAAIPSGYEVAINGARVFTGMDAVEWARKAEAMGAGEIVVNSIDQDGTHQGYDLTITKAITDAVRVPVIASGGAGTVAHIAAAVQEADVSAAIVSSILYSPRMEKLTTVAELKAELAHDYGIHVRPIVAA
jgi:cyclase